jgi:hypothetical protein
MHSLYHFPFCEVVLVFPSYDIVIGDFDFEEIKP